MRYFMSVFSPSREGRRNFLMDEMLAKYYYDEYSNKFSDVEKRRRFESGERIYSPYNNNIYIWGEEISDTEVFRRRLIGSVDSEILE